ncbi:MAG: hypothetical protein NTZ35_00630 [Ignavibacteriales bacterium]|nr:hypothetical protein [Ignavibacteriales bacterium]
MRQRAKRTKQFSYYLERKEHFNVLFPSEQIVPVSSLLVLSPEIVHIDPDPINGDVYHLQERGKQPAGFRDEFVITKRGLEKIARAAGIRFDPKYTRRSDDGRNPRRVEFQAVGSIQKPDGSWYSVCRSKEIHLDVIEQELRDEIESAATSEGLTTEIQGEQRRLAYGTEECAREITRRIAREMLKRRKNMVATADSGAYSRVVRSLLNLQTSYSHDELHRPFVVPSVALDLDYVFNHNWVRDAFINAELASVVSIFGPVRDDGSVFTENATDNLRKEAQEGENKKA